MTAQLVVGSPFDYNPYQVVNTDVDYTMNVTDNTVIATGPGLNITLPQNPFPGITYTIMADGGNVLIHGGANIIQGGDFSVDQGKLTILSFSSASGEWSHGDPSNAVTVPPDIYINLQIGKDSNNGQFPTNGVNHNGPLQTWGRLSQILGSNNTLVPSSVGTFGPGVIAIHFTSGNIAAGFPLSDPIVIQAYGAPGVSIICQGAIAVQRSAPITAVQTRNAAVPAGGTPWAITTAGGMADAIANSWFVQVPNSGGSGNTVRAWPEKDLGAGKTQMSNWWEGTADFSGIFGTSPAAATDLPTVGNTAQICQYTPVYVGQMVFGASGVNTAGPFSISGITLSQATVLDSGTGIVSMGVQGGNTGNTFTSIADSGIKPIFQNLTPTVFMTNCNYRNGFALTNTGWIGQNFGFPASLIAGGCISNVPGSGFSAISSISASFVAIDGDFGIIGTASIDGNGPSIIVSGGSVVAAGQWNAWDTNVCGMSLFGGGTWENRFVGPLFGDQGFVPFYGNNPATAFGFDNSIFIEGDGSNTFTIEQTAATTATIALPNLIAGASPTNWQWTANQIASNSNSETSFPFDPATGHFQGPVANTWANFRVNIPGGFRNVASIPNVQPENATALRPDQVGFGAVNWNVLVSPGP